MRLESVYVAGAASWLPPTVTVEEARAAGWCDRQAVWRTGITSVCVAQTETAPQMAVRAAGAALRQAGCAPDEIDLVLHASIYYQGYDLWPAASYVQRHAVGNRCPAIEVNQMSNGGMAAIELAAGYLEGGPGRNCALITTGDRFHPPGIDRWTSDRGTILADGGTAMVLSTREGFLQLRSLVTISDPGLEEMQRYGDPPADAPLARRSPIDVDAARRAFVAAEGLDAVIDRIEAGQREVVKRALSEAEYDLDDIDWFVLPNLGRPRLVEHFLRPLSIDSDRTTWPWGRQVGHVGAGDQLAGLGHLADSGALVPGHRCLLAGVGAGFTWSCAVGEVL
jgi:3-oxoacyl-[acyl-carrier-protein] synthase-3